MWYGGLRTDMENGSTAVAVVRRVAEHRNAAPTELPPLEEAVDCDALDALFGDAGGGGALSSGSLTFRWDGTTVTVRADGTVEVGEKRHERAVQTA